MKILEIFQNAEEELGSTKLNNAARAVWQQVAVFLWSMFRSGGWTFQDGFLDGAAAPAPQGGTSVVELAPGLAVVWDAAEGDKWEGKLKPIFLSEKELVDFTTNSATDPRIDSVFLKPVEVKTDEENRDHMDASTGNTYEETVPQTRRRDYEYTVVEGAAASNPSPPAAPSSDWIRVVDVTRPSGQVAVQSDDLDDRRNLLTHRPGQSWVSSFLRMAVGSVLHWGYKSTNGHPAGSWTMKIAYNSAGYPYLQIDDPNVTHSPELAIRKVITDTITSMAGNTISFETWLDGYGPGNAGISIDHLIPAGNFLPIGDGTGTKDAWIENYFVPMAIGKADYANTQFYAQEGFEYQFNVAGNGVYVLDFAPGRKPPVGDAPKIAPIAMTAGGSARTAHAEVVDDGDGNAQIVVYLEDEQGSSTADDFTIAVFYLGSQSNYN